MSRLCVTWFTALGLVFLFGPAKAEAPQDIQALPQVNVEARVAMPPVWRAVSREGALLVIGTLSPVPAGLDWHPKEFDRVLAGAGSVVLPPKGVLKLGLFGRAALAASLSHTELPDGASLAQFLSADDFHYLEEANRRFNHGDESLLHLKPGSAATTLRDAALKAMGLRRESPVYAYLESSARSSGARLVSTRVRFDVHDARTYARAIDGQRPEDIRCLALSVRLFAEHPEALRERAQAWANGEPTTARDRVNPVARACQASLHPAELLAQHGVVGLQKQLRAAWIKNITAALGSGGLVVAAVPMRDLTDYLGVLRQHGFVISGPDLSVGRTRQQGRWAAR